MVERKMELRRRRHRQQKMRKLKSRFAAAKDSREKEHILQKIRKIAPLWTPTEPARA